MDNFQREAVTGFLIILSLLLFFLTAVFLFVSIVCASIPALIVGMATFVV